MSNKIEKLTWQEIVERYPNQWVGLSEVEWEIEGTHKGWVKAAVVKYSDLSADELTWKQLIDKEDIFSTSTGIDKYQDENPFGMVFCEFGFQIELDPKYHPPK